MRALVVYESMYGNTHAVAVDIAAGLRATHKQDSGLTLDPDADGPGLRTWLEGLSADNVLAASFDTRLSGIPALTGRASRGISRLLKSRGCRLLVPPESFLVSKQNVLLKGESARARSWGALIGEAARAAYTANRPS
jgi:hypothetical protein